MWRVLSTMAEEWISGNRTKQPWNQEISTTIKPFWTDFSPSADIDLISILTLPQMDISPVIFQILTRNRRCCRCQEGFQPTKARWNRHQKLVRHQGFTILNFQGFRQDSILMAILLLHLNWWRCWVLENRIKHPRRNLTFDQIEERPSWKTSKRYERWPKRCPKRRWCLQKKSQRLGFVYTLLLIKKSYFEIPKCIENNLKRIQVSCSATRSSYCSDPMTDYVLTKSEFFVGVFPYFASCFWKLLLRIWKKYFH